MDSVEIFFLCLHTDVDQEVFKVILKRRLFMEKFGKYLIIEIAIAAETFFIFSIIDQRLYDVSVFWSIFWASYTVNWTLASIGGM